MHTRHGAGHAQSQIDVTAAHWDLLGAPGFLRNLSVTAEHMLSPGHPATCHRGAEHMRHDPPKAHAPRYAFITPKASPMTAEIADRIVIVATFSCWQHDQLFHTHLPARFNVAEHCACRHWVTRPNAWATCPYTPVQCREGCSHCRRRSPIWRRRQARTRLLLQGWHTGRDNT